MMPQIRLLLLTVMLSPLFGVSGVWALDLQWNTEFFENRAWFLPLVSEPRSSEVKVVAGWISKYDFADASKVDLGEDPRIGMDLSVGKEIPIFIAEQTASTGRPFQAGEFGIGFWAPISFHMLWDLAAPSRPIVNTDYRFGFVFKGELGLENQQRIGLRITPWAHESSHLGDELSLFASKEFTPSNSDDPFERINVSHNFWEISSSWEATGLFDDQGTILKKLGIPLEVQGPRPGDPE